MANYMTRGGYGNPWAKGYHGKNVVTVYAPNGVPFQVHREAAPAFQGFVNELAASGYNIRPTDSGGYNLRTKRGGTSTSQHGFGNAIDINWTSNLFSRKLTTDMPANVTEMARKWGLEWGGNWRGKKDAMHFEWTGAPVMPGIGVLRSKEDITAAQQSLAAQGLYNGPIDGEAGPLTRQAIAALGPGSAAPAGAPQAAQSAIASLTAPGGGTQAPTPPSPLQGFAPTIPEAGFGRPASAQAAIADVFGFPPPPPTAQAFAPTVPDVGPATPRRPGPGGALGVDLGLEPAGMPPPPSRPGSFDWLGGGAPDAGLVPTPGISPLRPQIGGPGDRRPQPPLPTQRPQRPVDAFSAPAGPLDLIPYSTQPRATATPAIAPPLERANRIATGRGGPVIPISPAEMAASLANANANTEMSLGLGGGGLGTPETALSLASTFPRPPMAAPSPWTDWTRAFDIPPPLSRMADAPPPVRPTITPDFDFAAGPGPTFTPPSLTPDIRGRPEFPGSLPAAPPPLATAADDPYRVTSSREQALPYDNLPPYTEPVSADPFTPATPRPIPPTPPSNIPYSGFILPPSVPPIPDIPGSTIVNSDEYFNPGGGGVAPTEGTEPVDLQPQAVDPAAAAANQPNIPQPPAVAAAAPQDPQAVQQEEQGRRGWLGRLLGIGQGGGPGGFRSLPGFGGILNPNGFLNNMGTPPAFTPFGDPRMSTGFGGSLRTSGTSPSGTNWQRGTSTAFGGGNQVSGPTQAQSWQTSTGQTITAHTDPWTGQTFHSFGP